MQESDQVRRLFDEALLLSDEDRDELTSLLIGHRAKVIHESTVYLREELSDGGVVETHYVRPEDRRRRHGERFDIFKGRIKFSYYPPDTVNDIKRCLEQMARGALLKDPSRKDRTGEIIEEMARELFWKLPEMYEETSREAQGELQHEIQDSLLKKIGLKLVTVSEKDGVRVVRKTQRGVTERQIENPRHRPPNTGTFDEDDFLSDLEATIVRLNKQTRRDNLSRPEVASALKRHHSKADTMGKRLERCPVEKRGGRDMTWGEYVKYVLAGSRRRGQEVPT